MPQERYIIYEPYSDNVGTVVSIYTGSFPKDVIGGLYTTSPDPSQKNIPNLLPVLRITLDTKELYYDYESNETLEMRVIKIRSSLDKMSEENKLIKTDLIQVSHDLTDTQIAVTEAYESSLEVEQDNIKTQIALTEVYEDLLKTQAALSTVNLAIQTLQTEIAKLKGE